jgi:hypothetical protein
MPPHDRLARILTRARLWIPLAVIAAVPVSVLAAGGSGTSTASRPALTALDVPNETNTTTGIGRSLCHIIGTQACSDSSSSAAGTTTGGGTDTSGGTGTASETDTASATSSAPGGPPETGLCTNVRVPGCHTTTSSSTVSVAPPSTLSETSTKTKATKTHSSKTKSRSSTRSQAATTTVTVTVTESSSASSTSSTTTTTASGSKTTP